MLYKITQNVIGKSPYMMSYRRYLPEQKTDKAIIVLVAGGGHLMKVWETTPDGRKGWAPIFAENGREVITVEWACNSPEIYRCSRKELCSLTQKENMGLIKQVINQKITKQRKVIFLGWSMGGPQIFKLATDIIPERTAAILGYSATGPLNYFPTSSEPQKALVDLEQPHMISNETLNRFCDYPNFPKKFKSKYIKEYLLPFSPTMLAIQKKQQHVKDQWDILTIKNTKNTPPTFLIGGDLDTSYISERIVLLSKWLRKFQKDVETKSAKGFSHLGMLEYDNNQIVSLYLRWLEKRDL